MINEIMDFLRFMGYVLTLRNYYLMGAFLGHKWRVLETPALLSAGGQRCIFKVGVMKIYCLMYTKYTRPRHIDIMSKSWNAFKPTH